MEIEFKPKSKIGVIDYGVVNIGSLVNMLKKIGITPQLIKNPNDLEFIEKIILPGVGSFDQGIKGLREKGFIEALKFKALEQNAYILGICLGMQLLGHESEEGKLNGLGLIDGYCKKFKFDDNLLNLTVPHMGWNTTTFKEDTILFPRIFEENRFYVGHEPTLALTLQNAKAMVIHKFKIGNS